MLSNFEHLEKENYDLRKNIEVLEKSLSDQELLSEKYENLGKDYESQCKEYSENQKLMEVIVDPELMNIKLPLGLTQIKVGLGVLLLFAG